MSSSGTALFRKHSPELLRFLRRRLGCPDAASDLVQETFLRYTQSEPPAEVRNPRAYLFRIAENLATDHLRRRARGGPHDPGALTDALPSPGPAPDAALAAREQFAVLRRAIRDLPPRCRTAFLLHRVRHLSYSEIADELHISPKTVEKHLSKALAHCRDRLAQSGHPR